MLRIGSGLDVHAFAHGVPLWLGGVLIEHDRGLAGHSDGDAVVHALIDALLGATGLADIGQRFPSSEDRWRGARSTTLLAQVWGELSSAGWQLENADLTIVAAEPRLAPHIPDMRSALAAALGTDQDRVGVKATTTDGVGALGRADGVLAHAVALLSRASA